MTTTTDSALVPAANADITATLRALGMIEEGQISTFNRAKLNGATFELGDEMFPSNQKTKAPAFYARILDYIKWQGIFLDGDDADILQRPDAANKYCKSHLDKSTYPSEGGKYAMDGTECGRCPIMPYTKKDNSPLENRRKCQFRADLLFQLCTEKGEILDQTIWTLTLSPTSLIEYEGMRNEPSKGYIGELNFMHKLAGFGIQSFAKNPEDPAQHAAAITDAATALRVGQVIAAVRAVSVSSADKARNFEVVVLDPVAFVAGLEKPDLPAPDTGPKNVTPDAEDDLPF